MRVYRFNQFKFLFTAPALDLLFAGNGIFNPAKAFIPDKLVKVIPAGKTFYQLFLMLPDAPFNVICYPGIWYSSFSVAYDVCVI